MSSNSENSTKSDDSLNNPKIISITTNNDNKDNPTEAKNSDPTSKLPKKLKIKL